MGFRSSTFGRRGLKTGAAIAVGLGLVVSPSPAVGGGTAPTLTSLDFDLADTSAGETITITGTNLGGATSCTLTPSAGGTATGATITANTSGSLSFTMPTLSAGVYNVRVTTAGGSSNTLSIRAWDPRQISGIDAYWDARKGIVGAGSVTSWVEQSRSATYSALGSPTLVSNAFGTGKPGVRISSSQGFTDYNHRAVLAGQSTFAVAKWTSSRSTSTNAANAPLGVVGDNNVAVYGSFGASAGSLDYIYYNSGWQSHVRGAGLNDGTGRLIGVTHSSTSNEVRHYLGDIQIGATGTAPWNSMNGFGYTGISVGYSTLLDGWDGDIGAVVIANGVISSTDRAYLQKWARIGFGVPNYAGPPSPMFSLRANAGVTKNPTTFKVSDWANQVGSGSVAQLSSANQPTWIASDAGFNNEPAISFDGSSAFMQGFFATAIPVDHPFYVFIVASIASGTYILDGADTTYRAPVFSNFGPISSYANGYLSSGISTTSAHVIAAAFTPTNNVSLIAVDQGTAQASATNNTNGGLTGISLAGAFTGGNLGAIKVAEVRVYDRDLNYDERLAIMQELGTRYGIAVAA